MNEVIKILTERRSIRKFRAEMPPKELIEQIVEAGLYAPSGMGRQSSLILAVTDKKLRDKLSDMNRRILGQPEGSDPFYGAPAVLVVLADKAVPTYVFDGSLTMGNMLNAAHALGLGGIWIHRAKQEFETEEMKDLLRELGIEGEYEGIGHCAIGYADGELPTPVPRREGRAYYL